MNRFKWWTILLFSSGLVWWAAAIKFYEDDEAFGKQDIVVLSLYTPSILFSLGGLLTSMCFKGKTKTLTETILIFANLINWIMIAIATLVDVDTHLKGLSDLVVGTNDNNSYEGGRDIKEPNIYFFSFGSLFISVYLTSSWVKQYILRDENALTTTQWMLLATSGFLVMIAGCSQLQTASCGNDDEYGCSRVIFSICNGLLSGVTSCLLVPWRSAPLKCQGEFAMILLISWAAAIPILTFKSGPAVDINTMYFGIYISFHLALNILSTTAHADALLEASAYSQVQFDMTETEKAEDELGAAGFLDFAYANLTHPQAVDPADDLRNADPSEAMLFEPVKVYSSVDGLVQNSWRESQFNRKVILGKHDSERIQIWFCLLVESSVCIAVFYDVMDKSESFADQWIVLAPVLSVILCTIGWVTSLVQKKCARMAEGVLILSCIGIWIRDLIAVTYHFKSTANQYGGMGDITANQLFMSYGSFFTSLYLFANWSNASVTTIDWIFLSATSATIFGVVHIVNEDSTKDCIQNFADCGQLELVIILAFGSAIGSFVMVLVSLLPPCGQVMPIVHVTIGTAFLALWCFGSYLIVFNKDGVGTEIGPSFFACWGVLFFCVDVVTTNLLLLFKSRLTEDGDEDADSLVASRDGNEAFEDENESQRLSIHDLDLSIDVDGHDQVL